MDSAREGKKKKVRTENATRKKRETKTDLAAPTEKEKKSSCNGIRKEELYPNRLFLISLLLLLLC